LRSSSLGLSDVEQRHATAGRCWPQLIPR